MIEWFEEELWAAEPLVGDRDEVAIWEGVVDVALAAVVPLLESPFGAPGVLVLVILLWRGRCKLDNGGTCDVERGRFAAFTHLRRRMESLSHPRLKKTVY